MKTKKNKDLTNFEDLLTKKYGKKGEAKREAYEEKSQAFRLGVILREARKKADLTQEELAERIHTKKSYISRIERDASDIRLSTLMRIIEQGLGGRLKIQID